jgi:hypothetical protein
MRSLSRCDARASRNHRPRSPVAMRVFCLLLACTSLSAPQLCARGFLELLLGRHDLDVITVTDATPAGRQFTPASKDQPQYYVGLSLGFRDLGAAVGGIKEPPTSDVLRVIAAELAKQGYLPATEKSPPPSLVLAYTWGTLNADIDQPNPDAPGRVRNRPQIVRFLGGRKVGLDNNFFDPLTAPIAGLQTLSYDARKLHEIATEDFYIIVVIAYDLAALHQGKKQMLWMTRIAAPSLGFALADALPSMLAIAGPHLGRETARPVWTSASEKFKPNVKLGELQLIEYLGDTPLPVVDRSREALKPKKR